MPKTYFNDAVIGNSGVLACFTGKGELIRLFWPHPDRRQLFELFLTGLNFKGSGLPTLWLHDQTCHHIQQYEHHTNILKTFIENSDKTLAVEQTDFVTIMEDVFVRRLKIKNTGPAGIDITLMHYSAFISNLDDLSSILFDFKADALIHYRSNSYAAVFSDAESRVFQLGNNAYENALHGELCGIDSIGMMKDGAVAWELGQVEPGQSKEVTVYLCLNKTYRGVMHLLSDIRSTPFSELYNPVRDYWREYLAGTRRIRTGYSDADELYLRSLLVLKLMCDRETGGILAAPEIDEEFIRCGRYAYCWGRDAGFIAEALDACGLTRLVDRFYEWAAGTQDVSGFWHQRYTLDGNLAPSWGLQIDETGTLVRGILQHYKTVGSIGFLEAMWPVVKKAVDFMADFIDPETGLPGLSFDLWEERYGVHAYSSGAVCSGIRSGIEIAGILDCRVHGQELNNSHRSTHEFNLSAQQLKFLAESLKKAIDRYFWKDGEGLFLRSIRTKLNPWGNEPSGKTVVLTVNPKGCKRDFTLEDATADSSLLGLSIPFGIYSPEDEKMRKTCKRIESLLSVQNGGIRRYNTDAYIGGNPWIVTTLWLSMYYVEIKDYRKALGYFDWALKGATSLGLLPEQLDGATGRPAWVIPLTWSHAMYVLLLIKLFEAGCFKQ